MLIYLIISEHLLMKTDSLDCRKSNIEAISMDHLLLKTCTYTDIIKTEHLFQKNATSNSYILFCIYY